MDGAHFDRGRNVCHSLNGVREPVHARARTFATGAEITLRKYDRCRPRPCRQANTAGLPAGEIVRLYLFENRWPRRITLGLWGRPPLLRALRLILAGCFAEEAYERRGRPASPTSAVCVRKNFLRRF